VLTFPDGSVAAVVGDVAGRGLPAAAAVAQLRSTIRAYAVEHPSPAEVFGRVDRFFEVLGPAQLATAVYLAIEPGTGRVRVATAGQLPPLLVDQHGPRVLTVPGGSAFGVDGGPREEGEFDLAQGAALVVVTDGAIERRGEGPGPGIERVLRATAGPVPANARALLARVLAAVGDTTRDDVTILVLRRS
jgi:chemotaxis family two-component system sensor kinase Cph1